MRGLFRLLSMVALAIAVIMAVLDATRSIATDTIVMTPLRQSWEATLPASIERFELLVRQYLPGFLWDPVILAVLSVPGFAIFAGLSLLLYMIARGGRGKSGSYALQR